MVFLNSKKTRWTVLPALAGFILSACGTEKSVAPEADPLASYGNRDSALLAVTEEFGPLIVRPGEIDGTSDIIPWSSYFFPTREKTLFDGANSPLGKYDLVSKKAFQKEASSAKYEYENLFDETAVGWDGLCHAWAAASILEPEPRKPREIGGVTLTVGDQKGLLLKHYEIVEGTRQFGQRFNGMRHDEVFADIYPDQLHRFIEVELIQNRRPIIIDTDPRPPVWNTPIYFAAIRTTPDPTRPHVMNATMALHGAGYWDAEKDMSKTGTRQVSYVYYYDLYGRPQADGSFLVEFGVWTGRSVEDHPDFATYIPTEVKHRSRNKQLDPVILDKILGKT